MRLNHAALDRAGETTRPGPRCVAMGNTSHGIAITVAMHTHFTITAVSSLVPPPPSAYTVAATPPSAPSSRKRQP